MEQLMMLKFGDAPVEFTLPEEYMIRECREGNAADGIGWIWACETLNEGLWNRDRFEKDMIAHPGIGAKNIFLICRKEDGAIAGTATALDGEVPALHMVGMNKAFMGRGLCYPVSAAAVNRLIENGAHRIQLKTDEFRIPAIKTYLKMGFRPWYYLEDMQERWRGVFADMGVDPEQYFAYDRSSFRKVKV